MRVAVLCAGLDHVQRGYERSALELYHALRSEPDLDVTLVKGSGSRLSAGRRVWCVRRDSPLAGLLTELVGLRRAGPQPRINDHLVHDEQSLPELLGRAVRLRLQSRPNDFEDFTFALAAAASSAVRNSNVVIVSEIGVAQVLMALRNRFGLGFRILFANGGSPPGPPPCPFADMVQQLTAPAHEAARAAGEPDERQALVPRTFSFPAPIERDGNDRRAALRRRLGLPERRAVVLAVGAINFQTKRHDHLIREVAAMGSPRPFVQLLGHGEQVTEATALARALLGDEGFAIGCVTPPELEDHYRAADVFALASCEEGFGRAYVEAAGRGLPLAVHDSPRTRWVLEDLPVYVDMTRPGELGRTLAALLAAPPDPAARAHRQARMRARFTWEALRGDYLDMLERCVAIPPRPSGSAAGSVAASLRGGGDRSAGSAPGADDPEAPRQQARDDVRTQTDDAPESRLPPP